MYCTALFVYPTLPPSTSTFHLILTVSVTFHPTLLLPPSQTFFVHNDGSENLSIHSVQVLAYPRRIVQATVRNVHTWINKKLEQKKAEELIIDLVCYNNGIAQVVVHVSAAADIAFVFRKECSGLSTYVIPPPNTPEGEIKPPALPPMVAPPPSDMLFGLVVAIASTPDSINSLAVRHGQTDDKYNADVADPESMFVVRSDQHFMSFFVLVMRQQPRDQLTFKPFRSGKFAVTASHDIVDPVFSGWGSEGSLMAPDDETYSLVSLAFHCRQRGSTLITVSIPVLGVDDSQPLPRRKHVEFTVIKECMMGPASPASTAGASAPGGSVVSAPFDPAVTSGLGGIGLIGFSVGLSPTTHEVVRDGFPTLMYFGQRKQDKSKWASSIVPEKEASMSVFLHYNLPQFATARTDDLLIPLSIGFKAPTVVAHSSAARPVLSDVASAPGVLHFKGSPLELDITFNCQYRDLVMVTVTIPIEPKGSIVFTVPKQCGGPDSPRGRALAGVEMVALHRTCHDLADADDDVDENKAIVSPDEIDLDSITRAEKKTNATASTTPAAASSSSKPADRLAKAGLPVSEEPSPDNTIESVTAKDDFIYKERNGKMVRQRCRKSVVRVASEGLVEDDFSPYSTKDSARFLVPENKPDTSFFIRRLPKKGLKTVNPLFGSEPMIYAHKPICRPELTHNLFFKIQRYLAQSSDSGAPLVSTLLPPAILDSDAVPISIDGLLRSINVTYNCVWSGKTPITLTIPIYPDTYLSVYWSKECPDSLGDLSSQLEIDEGQDVGVWSGVSVDDLGIETSIELTPATAAAMMKPSKHQVGYLNIGTAGRKGSGEEQTNVVCRGVPRKMFRGGAVDTSSASPSSASSSASSSSSSASPVVLPAEPPCADALFGPSPPPGTSDDKDKDKDNEPARVGVIADKDAASLMAIDPKQQYAIIPESQHYSRFYLSIPRGFQAFDKPVVKSMLNSYGRPIVEAKIKGPAMNGGNLTHSTLDTKADDVLLRADGALTAFPRLESSSAYIDVTYRCARPGLTTVLVAVPLIPAHLGSVVFRTVKFCGTFTPKASREVISFYSLAFILSLLLPVALIIFFFAHKFGCTACQRTAVKLGISDADITGKGLDGHGPSALGDGSETESGMGGYRPATVIDDSEMDSTDVMMSDLRSTGPAVGASGRSNPSFISSSSAASSSPAKTVGPAPIPLRPLEAPKLTQQERAAAAANIDSVSKELADLLKS